MGKYEVIKNKLFPYGIVPGCSQMGIFQNETENRAEYYGDSEAWRFDSINRAGIETERVFLPLPTAPPKWTPKHKVENTYIFNALNKDKWDTESFNMKFWEESLIWYLRTCKGRVKPIFGLSGFSSNQMIAPGVISERHYPLWEKVADMLIPICQSELGDDFLISPGNELYSMWGVDKAVFAKRAIGNYFNHIKKVMENHGLSMHNMELNICSGYRWETKEYLHPNTQDTTVNIMTGEGDPKNLPSPRPGHPSLYRYHGIASLDHFVGHVATVGGVKKYMAKFRVKIPPWTAGCVSFDGARMENNEGMHGQEAFQTIVDCQKFMESKAPRLMRVETHPRGIHYKGEEMPEFLKKVEGKVDVHRKHREAWSYTDITNASLDKWVMPVRKAYEKCHNKTPGNVGKFKNLSIWEEIFLPKKPDPIPDIEPDPEPDPIPDIKPDPVPEPDIIKPEKKEEKMKEPLTEKIKRIWRKLVDWTKRLYDKAPAVAVLSLFFTFYFTVRLILFIKNLIF